MQFASIPGLDHIKDALISSYKRNHLAHAQLFSGPEGSGTLPVALAQITYLLCEDKLENDSCGACSNCQKMAKYIHPDVHFFYPSSKVDKDTALKKQAETWRSFLTETPFGNIEDLVEVMETENKVNQISKEKSRDIIKTVSMKSFEGGLKILLIWYPEHMHSNAANAILKVLEEPPANTIYFLVTHNYEQIITTILSRTQLVTVPGFTDESIAEYLQSRLQVEPEKALRIGKQANGSLRKAIKDLESSQDMIYTQFQEWMRDCLSANFSKLNGSSEQFGRSSKSQQRSFLQYCLGLTRSSLLSQCELSLVKGEADEKTFVSKFGQALAIDKLQVLYQELNKTISQLDRNANARMAHLALSIRLTEVLRAKF
ncbi:MAG: DNA polymerase III subunit delta [Cyclobacteriaceae bacterium]